MFNLGMNKSVPGVKVGFHTFMGRFHTFGYEKNRCFFLMLTERLAERETLLYRLGSELNRTV